MSYYSKSFYVGEFDWTGNNGGANLDTFYSTIESMDGTGSMMWSLFGHGELSAFDRIALLVELTSSFSFRRCSML